MSWTTKNPLEYKEHFLNAKPFEHLIIDNFLSEGKAEELLEGLAQEEFTQKVSDLFQFSQTRDLTQSKEGIFKEFLDWLQSDGKQFFEVLTEINFKDTVDLHATVYQDTDYLLCHDDKLDDRVIAFLFYLSDMEEGEGGSLDLFSYSGKDTKKEVTIIPKFNRLAFFKVSKDSLHAVSEVVVDKQRIAIGGWFHA